MVNIFIVNFLLLYVLFILLDCVSFGRTIMYRCQEKRRRKNGRFIDSRTKTQDQLRKRTNERMWEKKNHCTVNRM